MAFLDIDRTPQTANSVKSVAKLTSVVRGTPCAPPSAYQLFLVCACCQAEVRLRSGGLARSERVKPGKTKNESFTTLISARAAQHPLVVDTMRSTGATLHRANALPPVNPSKTKSRPLNTALNMQAQPMPSRFSTQRQAEVWLLIRGSARPKWVKPGKTKNEGSTLPIISSAAQYPLVFGLICSTSEPKHRSKASSPVKAGKTKCHCAPTIGQSLELPLRGSAQCQAEDRQTKTHNPHPELP